MSEQVVLHREEGIDRKNEFKSRITKREFIRFLYEKGENIPEILKLIGDGFL